MASQGNSAVVHFSWHNSQRGQAVERFPAVETRFLKAKRRKVMSRIGDKDSLPELRVGEKELKKRRQREERRWFCRIELPPFSRLIHARRQPVPDRPQRGFRARWDRRGISRRARPSHLGESPARPVLLGASPPWCTLPARQRIALRIDPGADERSLGRSSAFSLSRFGGACEGEQRIIGQGSGKCDKQKGMQFEIPVGWQLRAS